MMASIPRLQSALYLFINGNSIPLESFPNISTVPPFQGVLSIFMLQVLKFRGDMIQYNLLGRTDALTRLNTTFWGLAPSPSSGRTDLPEDGDGASPRNVVFKRVNAAVRPRRLYCISSNVVTSLEVILLKYVAQ
jgi:hypothetical protein